MVDKGVKELCPTCGQPMKFEKSEKQSTNMKKTLNNHKKTKICNDLQISLYIK